MRNQQYEVKVEDWFALHLSYVFCMQTAKLVAYAIQVRDPGSRALTIQLYCDVHGLRSDNHFKLILFQAANNNTMYLDHGYNEWRLFGYARN